MTLVEGDPKAPFSIATTPRCRGRCYSILRIAPLYPWSSPYSADCLARWGQVPFFESLVWLNLGLSPSLLDHWRTLYSLGQWPSSKSIIIIMINKKKGTCNLVDFMIPSDHRVKMKGKWKDRQTLGSYISALGMVSKGLEKRQGEFEIRGRIKTIHTTLLLRSARILRRVLEIWRDLTLRFH